MKVRLTVSIMILLLSRFSNGFSQEINKTSRINPSLWDAYPWQGQGGIKLSGGTHNQFFFEIAYMKSDLPKQNSARKIHDYDYVFGNQNIFGGLAFTKTYSDYYLTPKLGYELNYTILSARFSSVNHFSFTELNIDSRVLLEPGLTLLGFIGVHYGYSFPISRNVNEKIGRHQVTLSFNYFDMWRPKYSNKK